MYEPAAADSPDAFRWDFVSWIGALNDDDALRPSYLFGAAPTLPAQRA